MKPYKPSNIVPSRGYLILLLTTIMAGGAIGAIFSTIGKVLYLIILFPAVMGGGGGLANAGAIAAGKVRNPFVAGIFGALMGCSIYGTMHYTDYLYFRQAAAADLKNEYAEDIQQALAESEGASEDAIVQSALDSILLEATGHNGAIGYLHWTARQGFTIDDSLPITGIGVWIYWILEFGIVVIVSVALSYPRAKEPFCEQGQVWYDIAKRLGNVSAVNAKEFLTALDGNSYEAAGHAILTDSEIQADSLEIYFRQSPRDSSADVVLTASKVSFDKKGNLKSDRILEGAIAPREFNQLKTSRQSA